MTDDDLHDDLDSGIDEEPTGITVSGATLTEALESLTAQLEDALTRIGDMRSDVEKLDQQLVRTQKRHNAVVDELVAFRDAAAETPLAGAIDDLLGEDIWHYDV